MCIRDRYQRRVHGATRIPKFQDHRYIAYHSSDAEETSPNHAFQANRVGGIRANDKPQPFSSSHKKFEALGFNSNTSAGGPRPFNANSSDYGAKSSTKLPDKSPNTTTNFMSNSGLIKGNPTAYFPSTLSSSSYLKNHKRSLDYNMSHNSDILRMETPSDYDRKAMLGGVPGGAGDSRLDLAQRRARIEQEYLDIEKERNNSDGKYLRNNYMRDHVSPRTDLIIPRKNRLADSGIVTKDSSLKDSHVEFEGDHGRHFFGAGMRF
eukprot:TRINITY_DN31970_c0_g1_i2.p1 TRINITY_DN31970_c0_g1~~TRINITY_DN31970_c0_g1_i2.p1  ORF type:complete len:283 (+),score=46.05 TRINITY_DN31970_c0_g1_i2:60-851(+)